MDAMHFSIENAFILFMHATQQNIQSLANMKREANQASQQMITRLGTMFNIAQGFMRNFQKETCQTGMAVELRSTKVLVLLKVKKKKIEEKLPSTENKEKSRDEEQSIPSVRS